MVNQEHLAILKQGVAAWNKWREENPDVRPCLHESRLVSAVLEGANLSGANLVGANLFRANLKGADLREAFLSKAKLGECVLDNARLYRVHLDQAMLAEASLKGCDLREANLSGATLSGTTLEGALGTKVGLNAAKLGKSTLTNSQFDYAHMGGVDFAQADLQGINLNCATLSGANFQNADLERALLGNAKLTNARFQRANLAGAGLNHADLAGAYFEATDLHETHLGGARCAFTVFASVDLSRTEGLSHISHTTYSEITTNTLQRTAQGISTNPSNQGAVETFLRGAGLDEHAIAFFRSLIVKPIEFYSCFISYSHADKAFARRLHDQLQARGIRCWLDEQHVLPGDHILDEVDRGIRLWDKVLLCCSQESLASIWVDRELEKALKKEERLWKERGKQVLAIIPLDLDGHLFNWQSSKADLLQARLAADFTGWEHDNKKFDGQFERVVKALRTEREEPPKTKL